MLQTKYTDEEIYRLYLVHGTQNGVGRIVGVSSPTIKKILIKFGVDFTTKPHIKWTYDKCKEEALKYQTRGEFQKKSPSGYGASIKKGFLNEICSHMVSAGSYYLRMVYVYEFSDKHVYVGLTCNKDERHYNHLKESSSSSVYSHMVSINETPIYKDLTNGYVDYKTAQRIEGDTIQEYIKKGWSLLNKRIKGGELGGVVTKWDDESLKNICLQYADLQKLRRERYDVYVALYKRKDHSRFTEHMNKKKDYNRTFESVWEIAKKYTNKQDFRKYDLPAWKYAYENNFMDEISGHMEVLKRPPYTLEESIKVVKEYTSRTRFMREKIGAYRLLVKHNLLDELLPSNRGKNKKRG
jgi:hypothetical protein